MYACALYDSEHKWTRLDTVGDGPDPRYGQSMVLRPDSSSAYVMGGTSGSVFYNDLWELNLDSLEWTRLSPGPLDEDVAAVNAMRRRMLAPFQAHLGGGGDDDNDDGGGDGDGNDEDPDEVVGDVMELIGAYDGPEEEEGAMGDGDDAGAALAHAVFGEIVGLAEGGAALYVLQ